MGSTSHEKPDNSGDDGRYHDQPVNHSMTGRALASSLGGAECWRHEILLGRREIESRPKQEEATKVPLRLLARFTHERLVNS